MANNDARGSAGAFQRVGDVFLGDCELTVMESDLLSNCNGIWK